MAHEEVSEVGRSRSRPFGVGDAMIFVIAVGLGLALARPAIALIFEAVARNHDGVFRRWPALCPWGACSISSC